jgi:hypothetical protein
MLYDGLYDGRYAMHISTGGPDGELWDCKHVAYYSPPNVHIYSLLAEQLCCSVMSLLV